MTIPIPPSPWVPTATHSETKLFPAPTMDAFNKIIDEQTAPAVAAAEAAAAAAEAALDALPEHFDTEDEAIAGLILAPTSETSGALNATIAEQSGTLESARQVDIGASAALGSILETASVSCVVQVLGDSTGNDATEWPRLMADWIAATYPAFGVRIATWDDTTQKYLAPVTVLTPPLGERHAALAAGNNVWLYYPTASVGAITSDLDAAFHVALDDWTPTAAQAFGGVFGGAGSRGWMLRVTTAGLLELTWSNDGTATNSATSSIAPTVANGDPLWVRFTLDVDNGATGRDIKFYTSTDGATWTQLGSTVTQATVTTIFQPAYDIELGSRSNGSDWLKGKIYAARIRNGIDGGTIVPTNVESWRTRTNNGTSVTWGGSPVVTILNASKPGADLAYLIDTTRNPKMILDGGTVLTFVSCSHNDGARLGPTMLADWDTLLTKIRARAPMTSVVVVGQNPRNAPADYIGQHAGRLAQLKSWAARNGCGFVDVYKAFTDYIATNGVTLASLLDVLGIHPTDAAQAAIWWPTVKAMIERRS